MARTGVWTWLREDVWEIPLRRYLALLVTAALVAGGWFGAGALAREDRSCAPGVERPEGSEECVGVSTSAYDFDRPQLREVIRAIDRENRSLKPGSYVTVALLEPFTASDPDNLGDVLHEMQGAYLAQYRANHESNRKSPAIRLVLANPGATGAHWEFTVDRLEEMTKSPDRLRAVTGVGMSTENNKRAVKELTKRGIPVIGSSITADNLANGQGGQGPLPRSGAGLPHQHRRGPCADLVRRCDGGAGAAGVRQAGRPVHADAAEVVHEAPRGLAVRAAAVHAAH